MIVEIEPICPEAVGSKVAPHIVPSQAVDAASRKRNFSNLFFVVKDPYPAITVFTGIHFVSGKKFFIRDLPVFSHPVYSRRPQADELLWHVRLLASGSFQLNIDVADWMRRSAIGNVGQNY